MTPAGSAPSSRRGCGRPRRGHVGMPRCERSATRPRVGRIPSRSTPGRPRPRRGWHGAEADRGPGPPAGDAGSARCGCGPGRWRDPGGGTKRGVARRSAIRIRRQRRPGDRAGAVPAGSGAAWLWSPPRDGEGCRRRGARRRRRSRSRPPGCRAWVDSAAAHMAAPQEAERAPARVIVGRDGQRSIDPGAQGRRWGGRLVLLHPGTRGASPGARPRRDRRASPERRGKRLENDLVWCHAGTIDATAMPCGAFICGPRGDVRS